MRQDEDPVQEVQTSSRTRSSGGRLTHSFYPVSRSRATMELSPHPNDICLRSLHMNVSWQFSIPIVKDTFLPEVVWGQRCLPVWSIGKLSFEIYGIGFSKNHPSNWSTCVWDGESLTTVLSNWPDASVSQSHPHQEMVPLSLPRHLSFQHHLLQTEKFWNSWSTHSHNYIHCSQLWIVNVLACWPEVELLEPWVQ